MTSPLIDRYAAGGDAVKRAIANLSPQDFAATPVPGKWSVQQLVVHLADAEQVFADRIKWVIAEDDPILPAFDENRWTQRLHYDAQSGPDAADLIALTRRQTARILRALPDSALARTGRHTAAGPMTLQALIEKATGHLDHHMKFLTDKLKALGKT